MKNHHDKKIVEYAKAIKSTLKEITPGQELIDSPESLDAFLKKEKLYKSKLTDRVKIIEKLANDIVTGRRDIKIDLDKIPSNTTPGKLEAVQIYDSLERQLRQLKNPTYDKTYQIVSKLALLIQLLLAIGSLLTMGSKDDKASSKKKEFVKTVKQIGDPNKKTPKEILSWVKNVMSMIKR